MSTISAHRPARKNFQPDDLHGPLPWCRHVQCSETIGPSSLSAAAARRAARIAFETRAVAYKREVSALLTGFALVSLHPRFADEVGVAPFGWSFDGAGLGVCDRRRRPRLCCAVLSLEDMAGASDTGRSEEHTSELQSLRH